MPTQPQLGCCHGHVILLPLESWAKLNLSSICHFCQAVRHSNEKSNQYSQREWKGKYIGLQYQIFKRAACSFSSASVKTPSLLFFHSPSYFNFHWELILVRMRNTKCIRTAGRVVWKLKIKILWWLYPKGLPGRATLINMMKNCCVIGRNSLEDGIKLECQSLVHAVKHVELINTCEINSQLTLFYKYPVNFSLKNLWINYLILQSSDLTLQIKCL